MRKRHTESDRLHYMKMLEEGYSIDYIHKHYGIGITLLQSLWMKYQTDGPLVLIKKHNIKADGALKEKIVKDIEENGLTLAEASVKYNVSDSSLYVWLKLYREQGIKALYEMKPRGRPPKDIASANPPEFRPNPFSVQTQTL